MSQLKRLVFFAAALALSGCNCTTSGLPAKPMISGFDVAINGVYVGTDPATRTPAPVVAVCANSFGGQANVPADKRGTKDCRFAIIPGDMSIDFTADAIGSDGKPATTFNNTVSFYAVPGDPTGPYENRFSTATNGRAKGTFVTQHLYGSVQLWVADAPPTPIVDGGLVVPGLPVEPAHRSYVTGLSPIIFFEDPTLAKVQIPDGFDNRASPFVGEFMTIGKNPESGDRLVQSCTDDPGNNGQLVQMVVTGLDPAGFYVQDITACRQIELTKDSTGATQVRTQQLPENCQGTLVAGNEVVTAENWDGGALQNPLACAISQKACAHTTDCSIYLPGTFGSMFVYNYSFPDGLDEGDLLWTVSGSVQEFTSTTQMTFPSWSIADKVRMRPPEQWNMWLGKIPIVEIDERICGSDDTISPFLTDQSCGHNKRNLKMESLESALVKIRNVKFPNKFVNCDFNNDANVAFFCEQKDAQGNWFWGSCAFPPSPPESAEDGLERTCWQDCVWGMNDSANTICSEESTFTNFGQFVVEMDPAGAHEFGFDEALPSRTQRLSLGASPVEALTPYAPGVELNFGCDAPTHIHFSGDGSGESDQDPVLPANVPGKHVLSGAESNIGFLAANINGPDAGPTPTTHCWVAQNAHYRINLLTRDALPELKPDCREDDSDVNAATQCKNLRAASFDITGHLTQIQPSRPRWMVTPRDPDDVCCRPGPGLSCPTPVKPCNGSL